MNLMFVTGRPSGPGPDAARDAVRMLSGSFVERGDRVRWLCPRLEGESLPSAPVGVEVLGVESRLPDFAEVTSRLYDVPNERVFVDLLRSDPPDLVHVQGFGGTATYLIPWLCERMGIPAVVVADPIEPSLCARQTLVDERGEGCVRWAEAARCLECCTTPFEGGMTEAQARKARSRGWLGLLAPRPVLADFENRLDMVVNGLDSAACVLVGDESAAEALARAFLPKRARVGVPELADVGSWAALYAEFAR